MIIAQAREQYRPISDPVVWTNGLFLLNAVLWASAGSALCASVVVWAAVTSFMYHRSGEQSRVAHALDQSAAVLALVTTVWVALSALTPLMWVMVLAALFVGLALKAEAHKEGEKYDGWHSAWHICVFAGQGFLALAYLNANLPV